MPNNQDRKDNRFSRYDAMSTEDLQAFLREDASKPVGEESDTKEILYVMEVLARRRKEQQEGKDPATALASFKNKYYTENETPSISESVPVAHKRSSSGRWKRGLVAAVAAVFILVIGNSITVSALGFDLFAIIAKWTQETFHFGHAGQNDSPSDPDVEDSQKYTGLISALKEFDISAKLAPTWFPEGYTEKEVRTEDTPKQKLFIAKYECGESSIRIQIADYLDGFPEQIEQSSTLSKVYTSNGIDYYIFENNGQLQAVWINDSFECFITGPLTLSEMEKIIDSIKEG